MLRLLFRQKARESDDVCVDRLALLLAIAIRAHLFRVILAFYVFNGPMSSYVSVVDRVVSMQIYVGRGER